VSNDGEWDAALRRLAAEPALRAEMGAAARRVAEERWAARVLAPPLARFLAQVAETR
jgi:hypothetical protein